jgi:hypothetical protein
MPDGSAPRTGAAEPGRGRDLGRARGVLGKCGRELRQGVRAHRQARGRCDKKAVTAAKCATKDASEETLASLKAA